MYSQLTYRFLYYLLNEVLHASVDNYRREFLSLTSDDIKTVIKPIGIQKKLMRLIPGLNLQSEVYINLDICVHVCLHIFKFIILYTHACSYVHHVHFHSTIILWGMSMQTACISLYI